MTAGQDQMTETFQITIRDPQLCPNEDDVLQNEAGQPVHVDRSVRPGLLPDTWIAKQDGLAGELRSGNERRTR